MNVEQRIDEILATVNADGNTSRLRDVWAAFFTLEEIVFQCDRDRPRSPLIINYRNLPTLLMFTSAEKAKAFAEKSPIPKLFHEDGRPVTLTLAKNEAVAFIIEHFKKGVKQFLLNCGGNLQFSSSGDDFMQEWNRHNGHGSAPRIDISDEFDALVAQLKANYSDELNARFWKKLVQLEKLFVVCPPDALQKPDVQLFEIEKGQPKPLAIAFTNEQHATAYAVRKGYVSEQGRFNLMAAPCSAWIKSFAAASDRGLYGVYFNPLTNPFHQTIANLVELDRAL